MPAKPPSSYIKKYRGSKTSFFQSAFVCFAISETTAAYSPENYGYFLSGITLGLIGVPLFCIGGLNQLVSWAVKKDMGQGKLNK